jgi:ATP/maltotriose-dependent transcriptional regulator MalT
LEGLALLVTDGYKSGVAVLKEALNVFRGDDLSTDERLRWSWIAGGTAGFIWDHESWDVLTARQERLARDLGALSVLPITLSTRVGVCLFAGEIALASLLVEQVQIVTDALDNRSSPNAALFLAAFRGDEDGARQLIEMMSTKDSDSRSEGMALLWARALLCNSRGRYEEAYHAATTAVSEPSDLWYRSWSTVELIEAASRTNRAHLAAPSMEFLAESTDASGTEWALAVQARCRALLSDDAKAETFYQEALERLQPTRMQVDLARAHLVYGEWLRRQRRKLEARSQLRCAHGLFVDFDMKGFADRAEMELLATGESVRKRTVETIFDLTSQERRISELAAGGASNPDIAEQLFISLATVEYHLSKVYRKLGIRSRTQLARTLR